MFLMQLMPQVLQSVNFCSENYKFFETVFLSLLSPEWSLNKKLYKKCHCCIKLMLCTLVITWDEAEELARDRAEWRQRVAQCTNLDAG